MSIGRSIPVLVTAAISAVGVVVAGAAVASDGLGVVTGVPVPETASLTLPVARGELEVRLPMAPGWSLAYVGGGDDVYPSDRGIITSVGLRERGYAPTAIVTVDRLSPGETADRYAAELAGKIGRASERVEETRGEVCGQPAHFTSFTGLAGGPQRGTGQAGMSLAVVPEPGSHAYVAVLQTRNLDNPGYRAQRDAMLAGFCVGS